MDIVKKDKKRIWCPGCGLFLIEKIISDEIVRMGWSKKDTVIVSGIGCTARMSEYFNLDSMHVSHGRTIPVAEGIKMANPKINVVIISGDGDLLSIGGNHLLHAIKRNPNISVFCNSNRVYAMTGGQTSPTTTKGEETKTDPEGYVQDALDIKPMFLNAKDNFFARTNTLDLEHFKKATRKTLKCKGFSFLEIVSPCAANLERKLKTNDIGKVMGEFKKEVKKYEYEKL
jgi:2-oxoglutarate/2-oxoacid ferredoxin oxidoreductase subunit beta